MGKCPFIFLYIIELQVFISILNSDVRMKNAKILHCVQLHQTFFILHYYFQYHVIFSDESVMQRKPNELP